MNHPSSRPPTSNQEALSHVAAPKLCQPPRHRMTGGDQPKGGVPGASGHAGRMRHAFGAHLNWAAVGSLVLAVLVCEFFRLAFASPLSIAWADTRYIHSQEPRAAMRSVDANGQPVENFAEPSCYVDNQGTKYRCVDPFNWFSPGTFTQEDITAKFRNETVAHCALATIWCDENVPQEFVGQVTQAFVWKILYNDGCFSDATHREVNWQVDNYGSDDAFAAFEQWYTENKNAYVTHGSYWTREGSQAVCRFWAEPSVGKLVVHKSSANATLSDDNPCYSLANATYGVWKNEASVGATDPDYVLTTNANGNTSEIELPSGTYWVREREAPAGYALDEGVRKVEIAHGKTTELALTDTPLYGKLNVWAQKRDAEHGAAQGGGTLKNAEITVRYYPGIYRDVRALPIKATRVWTLRTDENGNALSSLATANSDAFYKADDSVILPFGTYVIQETSAPKGYWLEGQGPKDPTHGVPVHLVVVNTDDTFASPVIDDTIKRAGIAVSKMDAESEQTPQGDASLAGIQFRIVNRNDRTIVVNGRAYAPGAGIDGLLVTDDNGHAETVGDCLPLGTYEVQEIVSNDSMRLSNTAQTITLADHQTSTVVPLPQPFRNEVARGGVIVHKVSRETEGAVAQGAATLAGARLSITLDSPNPVWVDGVRYTQGNIVATIATDDEGVAQTLDKNALPYGTYTLREAEAPTGYELDTSWSQTFSITEDGETHEFGGDTGLKDQVVRGGVRFTKMDADRGEPIPRAVFRVTSKTTHESHVAVTNDEGVFSTEAVPHTSLTNANDMAFDQDGKVVEEQLNPNAGIWFSGGGTASVAPNDELGALPYDEYEFVEIPSQATEGMKPVSFSVTISKSNEVIDLETVENREDETVRPRIRTTLTFAEDSHVAPAASKVTLKDTVHYENLTLGKVYQLEGWLVDKATGEPLKDDEGNPVAATKTLAPLTTSGDVALSFTIDSSGLAGGSVVAFERLHYGSRVINHDNIDDAEQTVRFPSLATTMVDEDGTKEVRATGTVRLVDHVSYTGLEPGKVYEIEGTLIDKSTKEPLETTAGDAIKGKRTFVPAQSSGTEDVEFSFDAAHVQGKTLVAFEELKRDEYVYAEHADLSSAEQTVVIPSLHTTLTDKDGKHEVAPAKETALVDRVSYQGLVPGATYTLRGVLINKSSAKPLTDASGKEIRVEQEFTPTTDKGSVEVSFLVDTTALAGQSLVAFEQLYEGEGDEVRELAKHEDLNDAGQTVSVSKVEEPTNNVTEAKEEHKEEQRKQTPTTKDNSLQVWWLIVAGIALMTSALVARVL